jgi:Ca2+:H+ antiporter
MNWLLIFVPIAIAVEHFAPHNHLAIFITAGVAILPLAAWMGRATEHLAERVGEGAGGLLNATFGNAAELIIALVALHAGLYDVVEASIIGSMVGNVLLVLGAAMLAGGIRHKEQKFNAEGARAQATMLTLAAIALILPAGYEDALGAHARPGLGPLSVSIAVILLAVYGLYLLYSLITHSSLFSGSLSEEERAEEGTVWSTGRAAAVLAGVSALIAWMSEILVGSIRPAAESLGLSGAFVGVFVVAILGNAAEHATAVTVAMKNRMDLALSIAIGSSVQVALFVAPVLVFASYFLGPAPMDLAFSRGLVLAVLLSVVVAAQVASTGRSDWLKGVQLLTVYIVLGLTFFFMPNAPLP